MQCVRLTDMSGKRRFLSWSELESGHREVSAQATVERSMIPSTAQKLADLAAADPIFIFIQLSLICFCIQTLYRIDFWIRAASQSLT